MRLTSAAIAFVLALPLAAAGATNEPSKSAPSNAETAKGAPAKADSAKPAPSTRGETAKADENRKKPLQRCDELKDSAQLECLRKARQRIVEARNKREAKGEK